MASLKADKPLGLAKKDPTKATSSTPKAPAPATASAPAPVPLPAPAPATATAPASKTTVAKPEPKPRELKKRSSMASLKADKPLGLAKRDPAKASIWGISITSRVQAATAPAPKTTVAKPEPKPRELKRGIVGKPATK